MGAVLTPLLLPYLPEGFFGERVLPERLGVLLLVGFFGSGLRMAGKTGLDSHGSGGHRLSGHEFYRRLTYTSLSGVKKEMRWAVPLEIGRAGGPVFLLGSRFIFLRTISN